MDLLYTHSSQHLKWIKKIIKVNCLKTKLGIDQNSLISLMKGF